MNELRRKTKRWKALTAAVVLAVGFWGAPQGAGAVTAVSGTSANDATTAASATGTNATAVGDGATASSIGTVAVGGSAQAKGNYSVVVGYKANNSMQHSIAIGGGDSTNPDYAAASVKSEKAIAIGTGSSVAEDSSLSVALGWASEVTGTWSTALGAQSMALADLATAVGRSAIVHAEQGTALGTDAFVYAYGASAVGFESEANRQSAIAIGQYATAGVKSTANPSLEEGQGVGSIAIGSNVQYKEYDEGGSSYTIVVKENPSRAYADYAIALGTASYVKTDATNSLALGYKSSASVANAVALGANSLADTENTISVGSSDETTGFTRKIVNVSNGSANTDAATYGQIVDAQAVTDETSNTTTYTPYEADTNGLVTVKTNDGGTAFTFKVGTSSTDSGLVIGDETNHWVDLSWNGAADDTSVTRGKNSTAYGYKANAAGDDSTAIGYGAGAIGGNSVAIGVDASAGTEKLGGQVAIGREANATGIDALALGTQSASAGNMAVAFGPNSSASGNGAIAFGYQSSATVFSSIAAGYKATVGTEDGTDGIGGIAIGGMTTSDGTTAGASVTANHGIALGTSSSVTAMKSLALGYGSSATAENAVALGQGSVADIANTISVGSSDETSGFTRKIVNVSNGSANTDAATYGQIVDAQAVTDETSNTTTYTPYEADTNGLVTVKTNDGGTAFTFKVGTSSTDSGLVIGDETNHWVDLSWNGAADDTSVTRGDNSTAYGYKANAAGNIATAIGYGANASDANSIAIGYDAKASNFASIAIGTARASGEGATAIGAVAYAIGTQAMALGATSRAYADNSLALGGATVGKSSTTDGVYGIAVGGYAKVSADNSVAIGYGSSATAANAVALGDGSVADTANTISVGSSDETSGFTRKIVNVTAGSDTTDAANYGQLVKNTTYTVSNGSVTIENNADGTAFTITGLSTADSKIVRVNDSDPSQILVGRSTTGADYSAVKTIDVSDGGTNYRKVTGIANGSNTNDAANYGQLASYNNGTPYQLDQNGEITVKTNAGGDAFKLKISGNGTITENNAGLITGATAYTELRPTDGTYVKQAETTAANLKALDTKLGVEQAGNYYTDAKSSVETKLKALDTKIGAAKALDGVYGANEDIETQIYKVGQARIKGDQYVSFENTTAGAMNQSNVIKDAAGNTLVTFEQGAVAANNNKMVSGGQVWNNDVAYDEYELGNDGVITVKKNDTTDAFKLKISGNGTIAPNNAGLITGGTAYTYLNPTEGVVVKSGVSTAANLNALDNALVQKGEYAVTDGKVTVLNNADGTAFIITGLSTADSKIVRVNDSVPSQILVGRSTTGADYSAVKTIDVSDGGENYRRITGVANGSNTNDAANYGQLAKNDTYEMGADGTITVATNGNGEAFKLKISGNGTISENNTGLITGGTAYTELRPTNGTYVKQTETTAANLKALDTKIGTEQAGNYYTDSTSSVETKLKALDNKIGAAKGLDGVYGANEDVETQIYKVGQARIKGDQYVSFENTTAGAMNQSNVIKDAAGNTLVTFEQGAVAANNNKMVSGGQVWNNDVAYDEYELGNDGVITVKKNDTTDAFKLKISGNGTIAPNNAGLITGGTAYTYLNPTEGVVVKSGVSTAANLNALDNALVQKGEYAVTDGKVTVLNNADGTAFTITGLSTADSKIVRVNENDSSQILVGRSTTGADYSAVKTIDVSNGGENYRRITGVANGRNDNDAANYGQLASYNNGTAYTMDDNGVITVKTNTGSDAFKLKITGSGAPYTAGDGITISNNVVSANVGDGLTINNENKIVANVGDYLTTQNGKITAVTGAVGLGEKNLVTGDQVQKAINAVSPLAPGITAETVISGTQANADGTYVKKAYTVKEDLEELDTALVRSNSRLHWEEAEATGTNAIAMGVSANASGANSVALGSGSIAAEDNVVSIGGGTAATNRRIVNVAAGTANTDAASYGQLASYNNGDAYTMDEEGVITVKTNTDDVAFKLKIDGTGAKYTGGDGITISNNTVSANVDDNTIKVKDGALYVNAAGQYADGDTGLVTGDLLYDAIKNHGSVIETGVTIENVFEAKPGVGQYYAKPELSLKESITALDTGLHDTYDQLIKIQDYTASNGTVTLETIGGKTFQITGLGSSGSGTTYTAGNGIAIDTTATNPTISVKVAENGGLTVDDKGLAVQKDGKVESGNTGLVTGGTVYDAMKTMDNQVSQLSGDINKVGAGAAALAALHPEAYDPNDKLSFAVGYGNYKGESAGALGAFFKPNADTTISLASTVGNGDSMVNMGVSFKLGNKGKKAGTYRSAVELVQRIDALEAVVVKEVKRNDIQDSRLNAQEQRIAQLQADIARMQQQIANLLADSGVAIH